MSEKYYDDVDTNTIKNDTHDTFCMHFSFMGWDEDELEGIDFVEDEMNRLHARVQKLEAENAKLRKVVQEARHYASNQPFKTLDDINEQQLRLLGNMADATLRQEQANE